MRMICFFAGLASAAMSLISCDRLLVDDIKKTPNKRADIVLTKAQQEIVPATREFTFDLIKNVVSAEKGNIFLSPFSLQAALSMASVGAVGETRDEINTAIGLDGFDTEDLCSFYNKLVPALLSVDNTVDVAIANSVWARSSSGIKETYSKLLKEQFHASAHVLDDSSAPAIDKWVNKSTKGMIKHLDAHLDGVEIMLLNALYFKGIWAKPFDKSQSCPDTFTDYSGHKSQVTFMNKELGLNYSYGEVASSVNIPYGNGAYIMTIVIPTDENSTIDDVLAILDETAWKSIIKPINYGQVSLSMPKFETECSLSLNDVLKTMGIQEAFSAAARFDEMSDESLMLTDVGQQAIIKVDEKGTEAAAVTHVSMGCTSAGPDMNIFNFKVDTPFFYAISELSTGTILFAGVQKWLN